MRSTILFLLAVVACFPACAPADKPTTTAATVTREQFKQITWIVGKWRGSEAGGAPFFESYRVLDDSTIAGTTWTDSTFSSATDPSIISLRNGEVSSGSSVVTQWDGASIHFEPRDKSANSYTWRKESHDKWTAQLFWTDKNGEARERTYVMTRIQ